MHRTAAPGSISINLSLGITLSVWKIIGAQHTEVRTFPSLPTQLLQRSARGDATKTQKYFEVIFLSSVFTDFSTTFTSCNNHYHLSLCWSVLIRHGLRYWYLSSTPSSSMISHSALSIANIFSFSHIIHSSSLFFLFIYHHLIIYFIVTYHAHFVSWLFNTICHAHSLIHGCLSHTAAHPHSLLTFWSSTLHKHTHTQTHTGTHKQTNTRTQCIQLKHKNKK